MKNRFPDKLITEHLADGRKKLLKHFRYIVSFEPLDVVTVPAGFVTDFASIPRPFWSIVGAPDGEYTEAAVIHDYIYHVQTRSRWRADKIFLDAMKFLKVFWLKRYTMWMAVRSWGWMPWNHHKRKLTQTPTDR